MDRPPHDARQPLLPRTRYREIATYAILIAGATLGAFAWGLARAATPGHAMALAFMTLAFAQIFHLGNARRERQVSSWRGALANPLALAAVAVTTGLQLLVAFWEPLAGLLHVHPLGAEEWLVVGTMALVPALVGQGWKGWRDRRTAA